MILVDTSIWIEVLRRSKPLDLASLVEFDEVTVCPPIVQEVLQGVREEGPFRVAKQALLAMPMVEESMGLDLWLEAAQLFRTARAAGTTVRSAVDCLIAACALRHDLEVLHRDRDFANLAAIVPLRQREP